uniref:HECT domain-containing protein n=1 Tax=Colobus angolensis palliatus TaxID=336983 RepID=A0A2K5I758_COLAP
MVRAKVMLLGRSCRRGGSVCHVGRCVRSDTLVLGAAGHITGDMPNGVRAAVSGVQSRAPWMAGSASRCVTREGPMHSASSSCTRQLRMSRAVCFLLRQQPHACLLPPLQVKRSRSKGGLAGPDGIKSVFGQMCAKMSSFGPDSLLLSHRVWKVRFVGESVDDCGGGYSESIAEICVLLGIAIRTGSPLSLNLAEPVWKQLAGMSLTIADLSEVDKDFIPGLMYVRDNEATSEEFEAMSLPFTVPSASSRDIQLSSKHTHLTLDNCAEYGRLAINYRLHEFDEQVAAVREGMARIVPVPLLSLFTGYELETMVCGSPDIPLHLLKLVATYKGVEPSASLIQWFWEVMESFSNTEHSLFLRFVWGRMRLPRTIANFRDRDFVIQVGSCLALSPRLECSDRISAHGKMGLLCLHRNENGKHPTSLM